MKENQNNPETNLKLRPHHVIGYIMHERDPEAYFLSDEEYIDRFREQKGDFHSDELILHWRDTIKQLHDNPNLKFLYVRSIDSICEGCEHIEGCHNGKSRNFMIVEQADENSSKLLPELEFGNVYDGNYLKQLSLESGWLEEVLN